MQAIFTKYLPPTNYKPSRIKAWCNAGELIMGYSTAGGYDHDSDYAHRFVAEKLAAQLNWNSPYYGPLLKGSPPSNINAAFCFVFDNRMARE